MAIVENRIELTEIMGGLETPESPSSEHWNRTDPAPDLVRTARNEVGVGDQTESALYACI